MVSPSSPTTESGPSPGVHPVEKLWRDHGLPEWFLGNGGTNHNLYALYEAIRNLGPQVTTPATPEASGDVAEIVRELRSVKTGAYVLLRNQAADALERLSAETARLSRINERLVHDFNVLNLDGSRLEDRLKSAEARLADAVEVLKDIEQVNEAEPREPDDADFRYRFLEVKRVVRLALVRVG